MMYRVLFAKMKPATTYTRCMSYAVCTYVYKKPNSNRQDLVDTCIGRRKLSERDLHTAPMPKGDLHTTPMRDSYYNRLP